MGFARGRAVFPWLPASAAAVGLGVVVALTADRVGGLPVEVAQGALIVVCATTIAVSARSCLRAAGGEGRWNHLGSLFLGVGSVFAFVIPGIQLLAGGRESRLAQQGLVVGDPSTGVGRASLLMAIVLIVFLGGETVATRIAMRELGARRKLLPATWNSRGTWLALVAISIAPIILAILDPSTTREIFEQRGAAEGRGALAVLGWAPALAVSLAVLRRHFDSKTAVGVSIALVAFLALAGNRSPLLLIFLAFALRFLQTLDTPWRTARGAFAIAIAVYVAAAMLVSVSEWRGETIRGQQASLSRSTANALVNPVGRLSAAGLDSLDGLVLATKIDRDAVGATWSDPTKVVTGFVPHQLWQEKPNWLTVDVARTYLRFRASGMYLSGAGYAWLIWGGLVGIATTFFLLGFGSSLTLRRQREAFGLGALFVVYLLVRFAFAGDAFDAFHTLGLAGLAFMAALVSRSAKALTQAG